MLSLNGADFAFVTEGFHRVDQFRKEFFQLLMFFRRNIPIFGDLLNLLENTAERISLFQILMIVNPALQVGKLDHGDRLVCRNG